MTFEFATAARIVFGPGRAREVPGLARELGKHALVVLGGAGRGRDELSRGLSAAGIGVTVCCVEGEPSTDVVGEALVMARAEGCDLVIAQGGGSAIDAAKAVAGLLANPGEPLDYLEVVGAGRPLLHRGVPFIAVPTTAGTGAEVTRNAVLDVPGQGVKVSLRSPHLLARAAVIDPELTVSLPPAETATTGMDALTQLIEPFVCNATNPLTDGLCREGMARVARALRAAHRDGANLSAREDMSIASLFGGLALANARLGAVHGFAGVLGGLTGHAHGAICARLLPIVMDANLRSPVLDAATRGRYNEVGRILTGDPQAGAAEAVQWVRALCETFGIVGLGAGGLKSGDIDRVVAQAQRASSMRGNPVELSEAELRRVIEAAM